jgi:transposase-like protein
MQLRFKNNIIKQNLVNVYNVYNLSLNNYNNIINKNNLNAIKQILRMQNKSIIIRNFNLHYFL